MFTREQLYSANGKKRTKSLFKETAIYERDYEPILSLVSGTHKGLPSLRDLYLALAVKDPSETVFAETVFGDLNFWYEIKNSSWFQPYYEEYLRTATLKRKSLAFQAIYNEVEQEGKGSLQAAKYLIEEPWKGKQGTAADKRKEREEVRKTAEEAYETSGIRDDVERLKESGLIN